MTEPEEMGKVVMSYLDLVKDHPEFPGTSVEIAQGKNSICVTDPYHLANLMANFRSFFGEQYNEWVDTFESEHFHVTESNATSNYIRLKKSAITKPIPINLEIPLTMKRSDLVKFLIYLNSLIFHNRTGKFPTPQESIFPVKNDLSLADDFVPHELMQLVEGSLCYDPILTLKGIQPFAKIPVILGIGKVCGNEVKEWVNLVPLHVNLKKDPETLLMQLGNFMSKQITDMELTPWYRNFQFGRITRSVLYQLSRKNSKTLRPPLFTDTYVKILDEHNLVDYSDQVPKIKEDKGIDYIKSINREAEKYSEKLANDWLNEEVQLPDLIL